MTLSSLVRVVIVEDQPTIRTHIQTLIQRQHGFIVVGTCGSVKEAVILIPSTQPDLLMLDISLSDGNAFDILQNISLDFKVIFLTAHKEHAIRAIKYGALDYLLKPIDETELQQALEKVKKVNSIKAEQVDFIEQHYKKNTDPQQLVLPSHQFLQIVNIDEIVYCQSDAGYTTFFMADGRKMLTSKYLKEYEELLPVNNFVRTHQSYIVNRRYIDRFHKEDNYLVLRDGSKIPVSVRRKDVVRNYLTNIH